MIADAPDERTIELGSGAQFRVLTFTPGSLATAHTRSERACLNVLRRIADKASALDALTESMTDPSLIVLPDRGLAPPRPACSVPERQRHQ